MSSILEFIIKLHGGIMIRKLFNKLCLRFERCFSSPHLNLFATIYINFRLLPFSQACKFPIYIYGTIKFVQLQGLCVFQNCKIIRGMIKIGRHNDYYTVPGKNTLFIQNGVLIFHGYCNISSGILIKLINGKLSIGDKVWFGNSVTIDCSHEIFIGDGCSITFNCLLSDSNHHYVVDENGKVKRKEGKIFLGRYNWVGNNSKIMKGTSTTDGTIITHGSLVNKDFLFTTPPHENSLHLPMAENSFILAGIPAKIIGYGSCRIFDSKIEKKIDDYFKQNPQQITFKFEKSLVSLKII